MDSCSQLSLNLLIDGLNKDGAGTNLLVSPLSCNIILNIIAGAATGATLKEILEFVNCDEIKDVNSYSSNMMRFSSIGDDDNINGAVIHILNGIWLHQHYHLKTSFGDLAREIYHAHVKNIDFVNKGNEVVEDANAWAKTSTKGLVPEIIGPSDIDGETFVIGNALYFKGTWMEKGFDPIYTKNNPFYLMNGSVKSVPFMSGCKEYYYHSYESFELVKIPYQNGEIGINNNDEFSMYIFLPKEKDGLESLLHKAASDKGFLHQEYTLLIHGRNSLGYFQGQFGNRNSYFYPHCFKIPKFKFMSTFNAKEIMQKMGLKLLFDPFSSELKEMVDDEQLFVSRIFQKCFIQVDEKGTKAVALTGLCGGGCTDEKPKKFIVDHPFMFMIREDKSKHVLFVGVVLDSTLTS